MTFWTNDIILRYNLETEKKMSPAELKILETVLEKLTEAREGLSLIADVQNLEAHDQLFNQIFVLDEVTDIVSDTIKYA